MTTTSSSSGLSPEAKEFVPLVQNPTPSIPLYVDENTVASIYPSDQQPLMVQSIYPMILTNSKVTESIQFPEIEFHIQPSQQQQFHIDSCTNIQQQASSTNGNSSSNATSQIVLLPITNPANPVPLPAYYQEPQIMYSPNEPVPPYYPMEYCEQPLINFSLQQPTSITKSNRISSQQQRPSSFRQHYGINHSTHRPTSSRGGGGNRGSGHNNTTNTRNPYHDYSNRRNGPSYAQNSGRGNSTNSKRISSSYHSNDYNNYYHGSRSRGYASRSSQQNDERRKDHYNDYYNHDHDSQQSININEDGIPFEFRPEDFPSLPMNNQQPDKTSSTTNAIQTNAQVTSSSWNAIVSASRRRSTSPKSTSQCQDQRSDRSRSFNNKLSLNNERKSSVKKPIIQSTTKSSNSASKTNVQEEPIRSQALSNTTNSSAIEKNDDNNDDGFIQTKHQHRRLKRKNKNKEEPMLFNELSVANESIPSMIDEEQSYSKLVENSSSEILTNEKSTNDSSQDVIDKSNSNTNQSPLTDTFNAMNISTEVKQENSHHKQTTIATNSFDIQIASKSVKERKSRKSTKFKRSINKDLDDNQNQRQASLSDLTSEKQSDEKILSNETDTNNIETDHQNSSPMSSSSNNSSDTSDYDDAVDNFDDE